VLLKRESFEEKMVTIILPDEVVVGTVSIGAFFVVLAFLFPKHFSVRHIIITTVALVRRIVIFFYSVFGQKPEGEAERRVVSGETWDEFCDTLKAAGAVLLSPGVPRDSFTQAEGYRYLTRLLRAGLENYIECGDPTRPQLVSIVDGHRAAPIKIGNDNPDNFYQSCVLNSRYTYRLRGNVGTVHYFAIGTQAGQYGEDGGLRTVDYKMRDELSVDEDGHFEAYLSVEKPPEAKNWLRMEKEPEKGLLIIRQTFKFRSKEVKANVQISLESEMPVNDKFTCAKLDTGLKSMSLLVGGASTMFAFWARGFQSHVNQLPLFDQEKSNNVGGDPDIRYFHSYWQVESDEALVIRARVPKCDFWNFQLSNHWMESLDYRYYTVHANAGSCPADSHGMVTIIVSGSDPNIGGKRGFWVNTTGHTKGCMCWRWVKPDPAEDGENLPYPQCRLVKLSSL